MRFSFVFSLIFKNRTFFPNISILTKNVFLDTLKAKYQNDPNKVKKCHMFQVIEVFQARGICNYLLTATKKHTVCGYRAIRSIDKAFNVCSSIDI